MALRPLNSIAGFSTGDPAVTIVQANGDITTINFTANGISNVGNVGNLKVIGGSSGQFIQTDGAGNLTFATISTSSISNGNSNVDIPVANGNVTVSVGGNSNIAVFSSTGANVVALDVTGISNLGNVGNVKITGGNAGEYLSTDGLGNLSWDSIGNISSNRAAVMPYLIPTGESYIVNENFQGLYSQAITIDGELEVDGILIEVPISFAATPTQILFADNGNPTGNSHFTFDKVSGNIEVPGDILPHSNITQNLGSSIKRWNDIWLSNSTIYIGESTISTDANGLVLTSGSGGTFEVAGNANVSILQNGNSNIAIDLDSNIRFGVGGTPNVLVLTSNGIDYDGNLVVNGDIESNGGNLVANGVKTDNLYYANGQPWDLQQPAGSNTQIQFNNANNFGASANFTFNSDTNNLSVAGNIVSSTGAIYGNAAGLTNVPGGNVAGQVGNALVAGTVYTNAQPNITSVGTLSSLSVTGNVTSGNLDGGNLVSANYVTGTLTTSAQPNITSVGTLTGLGVNGTVTAVNVTANTGIFTGNAAGLTNIPGANITGNITGNISNAVHAVTSNTVVDAAQPNITSVGTLSNLSVSGNAIISGNLTVDGNLIYVNVETLSVEDPIIQLQTGPNGAPPVSNSGKDVGTALNYYDTQARVAFMGWDVSNAEFGLASEASISNEVVTFSTYGNLRANVYFGNAAGLTNIPGGNITGNLTELSVTGNANFDSGTLFVDSVNNRVGVANTSPGDLLTVGSNSIGYPTINIRGNTEPSFYLTHPIGYTQIFNSTGSIGWNAYLVGDGKNLNSSILYFAGYNNTANAYLELFDGKVFIAGNGNVGIANNVPGHTLSVSGNLYVQHYANIANVDATRVTASANVIAPQLISNVATGTAPFVVSSITQVANLNAATAGSALTAGTVTTNGQPNITSLGNLTGLQVNGVTNLGPASNVTITGGSSGYYLQTNGLGGLSWAAVPTGTEISNGTSNITIPVASSNIYMSVAGNANVVTVTGTGINVAGTLSTGTGVISGNGSGLTSLAGANVTGQVGNALIAGTVYTNAQPNITSVGTLTDLTVAGNGVFGGDLIISGNLVYVNVTELAIEDPIINLNTGPNAVPPIANSGKDVGTALNYYDTQARVAFMGWDVSNAEFAFGSQTSISSEVVTFDTLGNVRAQTFKGNIEATTIAGNLTTATQSNITTVGTLGSLNVTGNIDAGNVNGGNVVKGNYLVSNSGCVSVNGAMIAFNNATGMAGIFSSLATDINFGLAANIVMGNSATNVTVQGNLIANGNITGNLISGTLTTNAQPNITSVGTLTSVTISGNATANNLSANTVTTNSTIGKRGNIAVSTDTVIDSFSASAYRTAKYVIKSENDDGFESLEVLLIHNNINSFITVYAAINDGGGNTVAITTGISSGNVELRATGLAANTVVNLIGTYVPD